MDKEKNSKKGKKITTNVPRDPDKMAPTILTFGGGLSSELQIAEVGNSRKGNLRKGTRIGVVQRAFRYPEGRHYGRSGAAKKDKKSRNGDAKKKNKQKGRRWNEFALKERELSLSTTAKGGGESTYSCGGWGGLWGKRQTKSTVVSKITRNAPLGTLGHLGLKVFSWKKWFGNASSL